MSDFPLMQSNHVTYPTETPSIGGNLCHLIAKRTQLITYIESLDSDAS